MLTIAALSLIGGALAQQVGKNEPEVHPSMSWTRCSGPGSCQDVDGEVVIDANWRWTHRTGGYNNCYDGNKWTSACSSNEDCAKNCEVEGAKYQATYGASTSGDALTLKFTQQNASGRNVGSRIYLMADETSYEMFDLIGNEFSFDVDLSTVACGINSALYFVAMPEDGGSGDFPVNTAGAKYGTGYCDSQCARDLKFLAGQGNYEGWMPSDSDASAGVGHLGSCCAEIDVWESNSHSFALTPHACEVGYNDFHVCEGDEECGGTYSAERYNGHCDANGCDFNPYRMGVKDFYGEGKTLDTSKPFTVVTQFESQSLHQFFIQDGQKIEMPNANHEGLPETNEVSPEICDVLFDVFDDYDRYTEVGGWTAMEDALSKPMVLVMSIWADHYSNMLWLDGLWPRNADPATPGTLRGDCPVDSGEPAEVIAQHPDAYVTWSNIRFGPIGSTTD